MPNQAKYSPSVVDFHDQFDVDGDFREWTTWTGGSGDTSFVQNGVLSTKLYSYLFKNVSFITAPIPYYGGNWDTHYNFSCDVNYMSPGGVVSASLDGGIPYQDLYTTGTINLDFYSYLIYGTYMQINTSGDSIVLDNIKLIHDVPPYLYNVADIHQSTDYSPFGVTLEERNLTLTGAEKSRYSFQGQEHDDEIKGEGNSVNFEFRMHDPRIGRFFAIDPMSGDYPFYSTYSFSGNRVIDCGELEGLEPTPRIEGGVDCLSEGAKKTHKQGMLTVTYYYHNGGKFTQPGYYSSLDYRFMTKKVHQDHNEEENKFILSHPFSAYKIGSGKWNDLYPIATSAAVFSTNAKFDGKNDLGEGLTKQNAFRHSCLMAFTTFELGRHIAEALGNAHEDFPNLYLLYEGQDLSKVKLTDVEADAIADQYNNFLGKNMGESWWEKKLTRKQQAMKVLDYFHTDGLAVGVENSDGTYSIEIQKLSDKEYNEIKSNLNQTNNWGYNKKDGKNYEKTK